MTTRMFGSSEIAEDCVLSDYTLGIFRSVELRNSIARVFIPWLPTPAHVLRMWDAFRLWRVLSRIIKRRKQTGVSRQDSVQFLMDSGTSTSDIIAVSRWKEFQQADRYHSMKMTLHSLHLRRFH